MLIYNILLEHEANRERLKLEKLFPKHFDSNLSESQIMSKTGYHKCYGSGNKMYIFR